MTNIHKILLCMHPEAPNPELVERAANIAKQNHAAVKVFHTVGEYPEDISQWWNVRNPEKLKGKIVSEREAFLHSVSDQVHSKGVDKVSSVLHWGEPFLEISREVIRNHHDLVMITSMHRSKLSRMVLNCPSMDLLQHCPCTLWISQGGAVRPVKRVLATLGGRDDDPVCESVDVKVMRTAATIAESNGAELHVVRAMPLYGGKGRKGKKLRDDLEAYLIEAKEKFMAKCAPVLQDYQVDLPENQVYLPPVAPLKAIVDLVEDLSIDVVVMGTMPKLGLPTLLASTLATKVFDNVSCDLVTIKPDDFVSLLETEKVVTPRAKKSDAGGAD